MEVLPQSTKTSTESLVGDARALGFLKDFKKKSEEYTRPYYRVFSRIFSEYCMARADVRNAFQRANLRNHYPFLIVESFTPELVEAFFGEHPYVNAIAQRPEFYQFEQPFADFLSNQLDLLGVISKSTIFFKNTLLYGTAIVKTPWKDMNPGWENVNIFDFYPDPRVRNPGDIDSMSGVGHRVWRDLDELKVAGIYKNLDKLEDGLKEQNAGSDSEPYVDSEYQNRRFSNDNGNLTIKNKIEVFEYWGNYRVTDDGNVVKRVMAMANNSVIIRDEDNPLKGQYKPFKASVNYPIPGEFFGMGEIEPYWPMMRENISLRNARLDAVNLTVNPMWIADRNAGLNFRNLYTRSGGLVLTDDINGIKPLEFGSNFFAGYREIPDLDFMIQNTAALPNPSSSVSSGFARTQDGVQFLANITSSRLKLKVRIHSEMFFVPFVKRMVELDQQFLPADIQFRQTGNDLFAISQLPLEAINKNYIFSFSAALDRLTKKGRQGNLKENIIPLLQLNEQAKPGGFDWSGFTQQCLKDFDYPSAAKWFYPEEHVQQKQQQQMQQQMQMAQFNAQAQAEAQAYVIQTKEAMNRQTKDDQSHAKLVNTVVKGVMDNERAETDADNRESVAVGTAVVKKLFEKEKNGTGRNGVSKSGSSRKPR